MIKHILKYGLFTAFISLMMVNLGSCNDSDSDGGAPEILFVRFTDPTTVDSTFVQSNAGQWIAIIGKNLQGTKKVYINDQDVFFWTTYNTETSLVVQIPNERNMTTGEDVFNLLYTTDGGVLAIKPGTIRVETDKGTASYEFTVLGGNPAMTKVEADNYPTPAGDKITVTGTNFVNIQRVYFTNISPDSISKQQQAQIIEASGWNVESNRILDPVNGWKVNSTITFNLPDLPRVEDNYFGFLVVEGMGGTKTWQKFSTLPAAVVESISSDMPIVGQTVTIIGKYFTDVQEININGDKIVILPEDLMVTRTSISFIMPAKPTNPINNPLTIVTKAGSTTLNNFYPTGCVFIDFDSTDKTVNQGWDPKAAIIEADGTTAPYISDGNCAYITGDPGSWWGPSIYWKGANGPIAFPSYDVIPAATPTTDVYLSYECYNTIPFSLATTGGTFIKYGFGTSDGQNMGGSINYEDYEWEQGPINVVFPGVDGQPVMNNWYQVLIPLSRFGTMGGKTYKDFATAGIVELFMQTQYNGGPQGKVDFYIENVRIVTKLTSAE